MNKSFRKLLISDLIMFGLTPLSRGEQCWRSILHISVRRLNPHSFDNAKNIDRNPVTLKPDKLRITIPVPVQNRAMDFSANYGSKGHMVRRPAMANKM